MGKCYSNEQPKEVLPSNLFVAAWLRLNKNSPNPWVLFSHGTCVELPPTAVNHAEEAIEFITEYGPVFPGCSHGDFNMFEVKEQRGWIVTSHRDEMSTYVSPGELTDQQASQGIVVGLFGRSKRNKDAEQKEIIYIQKQPQKGKK